MIMKKVFSYLTNIATILILSISLMISSNYNVDATQMLLEDEVNLILDQMVEGKPGDTVEVGITFEARENKQVDSVRLKIEYAPTLKCKIDNKNCGRTIEESGFCMIEDFSGESSLIHEYAMDRAPSFLFTIPLDAKPGTVYDIVWSEPESYEYYFFDTHYNHKNYDCNFINGSIVVLNSDGTFPEKISKVPSLPSSTIEPTNTSKPTTVSNTTTPSTTPVNTSSDTYVCTCDDSKAGTYILEKIEEEKIGDYGLYAYGYKREIEIYPENLHQASGNPIGKIPFNTPFTVTKADKAIAHVEYNGIKGVVDKSQIIIFKEYFIDGDFHCSEGSNGTIRVDGWAIDKNDPKAILEVTVRGTGSYGSFSYTVIADQAEPYENYCGGIDGNHCFSATVPVKVDKAGDSFLCEAYAINTKSGLSSILNGRIPAVSVKPTEFTLTIAPMNGEENITFPLQLIYGSDNLSSIKDYLPQKPGYRLEGFYNSLDGIKNSKEKGTKVYNADGLCTESSYFKDSKYQTSRDLTVYANWIAEPYKVSFYLNNSNESKLISSKTIYMDQKYGTLPTVNLSDYLFKGWYTEDGRMITSTTVFNEAKDISLYGEWEKIALPVSDTPSSNTPELNTYTVTLKNGNQHQITANQENLRYKTNNPDVAVVSSKGLVTAIGEGTAIISVINTDGEVAQLNVTVESIQNVIYGDFNNDGKVDITDLSALSIYLVDKKQLSNAQSKAADVTGDGVVDLSDLAHLRSFLSKNVDWLGNTSNILS